MKALKLLTTIIVTLLVTWPFLIIGYLFEHAATGFLAGIAIASNIQDEATDTFKKVNK